MSDVVDEKIQRWLMGPFDEKTKAEIKRLMKDDPKALKDAFYKDISFGTGGMRGLIGVGTNRMNIYTIRMATQGLANAINKNSQENPSAFIGYDVRHFSKEFAIETAKVLSGNKIKAYLSETICPTPLVSFACRHFHTSAAVMITASHNPPEYNGYKVYGPDGAQVVAPNDQEIMEEVRKITSLEMVKMGNDFEWVGSEIDALYLKELKKLQLNPIPKSSFKIIYSNLHGTGLRLVPKALKDWGFDDVELVESQKALDGDFPNAKSPNPEEKKALEPGLKVLKEKKGDLLIATDPDADRIGVCTQEICFTGNQIACLCLYHICQTLKKKKEFPENAAFIKTIVTTELFRKIAEHFGGTCIDVLTGFKYIGELIGIWENAFGGYQFLFGAEESYGSLFGTFVRDKDAINASCLVAEMASHAKSKGKTLKNLLDEIYEKFGIYKETLINLKFEDSQEGMNQMKALLESLRKNPPQKIGNEIVTKIEDFSKGLNSLPPSNVLRFWTNANSKIVIRPSGTEPKVKVYIEAVLEKGTIDEADQKLFSLKSSFEKLLG